MKESGNLDVLRMCAVLFVLADHTLKFHGIFKIGPFQIAGVLGGVGVSFFFVHTCLVLMMSLGRQQDRFPGADLLGSFYLKRFFRIYPLSAVFVIAVAVWRLPSAGISTGGVQLISWSMRDLVSNLALVQNLTYCKDILGVLWSLPLEVQMYLFLPPLFLLVGRGRSPWRLMALWCVAVGLAFVQPLISNRLNLAQYAPSFLPGVIAYSLSKRIRPQLPPWLWLLWIPTLALAVIVSGDVHNEHANWLMCLALGISVPFFHQISLPWLRRMSFWIAKYSYGEYLCHVMCIWFAFEYLGRFPVATQWTVFVLLITGIPVLVFHTIEAPMIRIGSSLADKWFPKPVPQAALVLPTGKSVSFARSAD